MNYENVNPGQFRTLGRKGAFLFAGFDAAMLTAFAFADVPVKWIIVAAVWHVVIAIGGMTREAAIWLDARAAQRSRIAAEGLGQARDAA